MIQLPKNPTDPDNIATWVKYRPKLCQYCTGVCCSLPVEVKAEDLVRMGVIDEFELEEPHKLLARRLKKNRIVEHFHAKSATFTLSRMANGDCIYLEGRSRRCTIYKLRPATCRNHPLIGPRPGYCAFKVK